MQHTTPTKQRINTKPATEVLLTAAADDQRSLPKPRAKNGIDILRRRTVSRTVLDHADKLRRAGPFRLGVGELARIREQLSNLIVGHSLDQVEQFVTAGTRETSLGDPTRRGHDPETLCPLRIDHWADWQWRRLQPGHLAACDRVGHSNDDVVNGSGLSWGVRR